MTRFVLQPWAWRLCFFTLLAAATWASLVPVASEPIFLWQDKLLHGLAYCIFYLVGWLAYPGAACRWPLHLGLFTYGVGIELLQFLTGYRTPDGLDVIANLGGQVVGNLALGILLKIFQRGKQYHD